MYHHQNRTNWRIRGTSGLATNQHEWHRPMRAFPLFRSSLYSGEGNGGYGCGIRRLSSRRFQPQLRTAVDQTDFLLGISLNKSPSWTSHFICAHLNKMRPPVSFGLAQAFNRLEISEFVAGKCPVQGCFAEASSVALTKSTRPCEADAFGAHHEKTRKSEEEGIWHPIFAACVCVGLRPSFGQVAVTVSFAPPALLVYDLPPCPGGGYMRTAGYWHGMRITTISGFPAHGLWRLNPVLF